MDIDGKNPDKHCTWPELAEKISEISKNVSYDLVASDSIWEEMNLGNALL
jgi:hypothetical protein